MLKSRIDKNIKTQTIESQLGLHRLKDLEKFR